MDEPKGLDRGLTNGRMMLAAEWSRLPENRILCETHFDVLPRPIDLTGHPGCLTWVYDYLLVDYLEPARLVECPGGSILMWLHFYEQRGFMDYLMHPFTSELNGFSRDHWRNRVAPFVKSYDETTGNASFDFTNVKHLDIRSDYPCYFIGGRDNFLHWLVDHLTLALLPEAESKVDESVLVTSKLAPWQRNTLDFFGVKNSVIELEPVETKPTFFHFENLIMPVGYPLAERFRSLRHRYSYLHGQPTGNRSNIYLSRGAMRPRHRVANEDEVALFFSSIGFLVLYPEQMPLNEIAAHCANASIIATAPGSANGNFFVFAGNDAVLIYMVPSSAARGDVSYAQATVGYANLLIFVDRLVTVYGRGAEDSGKIGVDDDEAEIYAISDIKSAVDLAHSIHEKRIYRTEIF